MTKKELALKAIEHLEKLYPDAKCSLTYNNPFELLIATRLSAQCTDARVNMVTPMLFRDFPTAQKMADAPIEAVEAHIKTCGLYKTKARDLVGIGKMLVDEFSGNVPDTIEELTRLPGVGRKTANLILGDIYKKPAIVADTHFIRLSNRLGLVNTKDPLKVETQMRKLLPQDKSNDFCHRAVLFGRDICTARIAYCEKCPLADFCPKKDVKSKK